jgi:hypothetical protein
VTTRKRKRVKRTRVQPVKAAPVDPSEIAHLSRSERRAITYRRGLYQRLLQDQEDHRPSFTIDDVGGGL